MGSFFCGVYMPFVIPLFQSYRLSSRCHHHLCRHLCELPLSFKSIKFLMILTFGRRWRRRRRETTKKPKPNDNSTLKTLLYVIALYSKKRKLRVETRFAFWFPLINFKIWNKTTIYQNKVHWLFLSFPFILTTRHILHTYFLFFPFQFQIQSIISMCFFSVLNFPCFGVYHAIEGSIWGAIWIYRLVSFGCL